MSNRPRRLEIALFVLILVIGAALRLAALDSIPPGLTHDEADHGVDAAGVLEGRLPIYFTVGYGREPLFDYVTALVMLIVGKSFYASRLTSALFGVALLALIYAWVRFATHNRALALATMAGLAFSFWGVSTSRQALRSETLPVLFMAAALAMRRGIVIDDEGDETPDPRYRPQAEVEQVSWFVLAGVLLGLSIYTYLAARLMWLVFPAFYFFLSLSQPGVIRKAWPGLLIMLTVGAMVSAPLVYYLIQHPGAEVRVEQLSGPIQAFLGGDREPLVANVRAGLGMITLRGDDLWLYNIPGKPLLGPWMGLLFYLGVSIAVISLIYPYRPVRRGLKSHDDAFRFSSSNAFMLLTLVVGMVPALLTGISASSTRVIGMQPALYYFPALAVVWLADWAHRQVGDQGVTALWVSYGVLMLITAGMTIHSYFSIWANARDVRVAYHTTMVETLHYLDTHPAIGPDVALSTITPGRFHDPAIARMVLKRDDLQIRWFDGRSSLVLPAAPQSLYFFPQVAALDPALEGFLDGSAISPILLRSSDFDPRVEIIEHNRQEPRLSNGIDHVRVGSAAVLVGYEIRPASRVVHPGDSIQTVTQWRIEQPPDAEVVMFSHALDESGKVVAQEDLLGVPGWYWLPGDTFIQLHRFVIPPETPAGPLRIEVGAYTYPDIVRLPLTDATGASLGDSMIIDSIEVALP